MMSVFYFPSWNGDQDTKIKQVTACTLEGELLTGRYIKANKMSW
jgi:hypothetical protein